MLDDGKYSESRCLAYILLEDNILGYNQCLWLFAANSGCKSIGVAQKCDLATPF